MPVKNKKGEKTKPQMYRTTEAVHNALKYIQAMETEKAGEPVTFSDVLDALASNYLLALKTKKVKKNKESDEVLLIPAHLFDKIAKAAKVSGQKPYQVIQKMFDRFVIKHLYKD